MLRALPRIISICQKKRKLTSDRGTLGRNVLIKAETDSYFVYGAILCT